MKKSKTFRPLHFCILLASCLGYSAAAPFPPQGRETTWNQPGGQEVKLRVFGDEFYARTETEEGFTVVYNAADNNYYYAALSADGTALVPSANTLAAGVPLGLKPHLALARTEIIKLANAQRDKTDGNRQVRWNERVKARQALKTANVTEDPVAMRTAAKRVEAAVVTGAKIGLTIIMQFPDDTATTVTDPTSFPTDKAKIERFCNGVNYTEDGNTGSVREYFSDQSSGNLNYSQTVTEIITMPRARNYYNFSDYPTNVKIRPDAGAVGRLLLADALVILKAQNFNFSSLTLDASRRAIATNIFFAGKDSGIFAQGLWPHSYALFPNVNVGTAALPIYISNYQITNIENRQPSIGTFCHENGHLLLDYPDIYALVGEGVGRHCLMGSGNYLNDGRTPSPINLYFKEIVGWTTIPSLTAKTSRTFSLPTKGNIGYRIAKPGTPTENFVVENRGLGDRWAEYSRDSGILIWHIDEKIDGNFYIEAGSRYGIALMQADGLRDLEIGVNSGDSNDYFSLSGNPLFNDQSNPSAKWYDGSTSGIKITVASPEGPSTEVQFGSLAANEIAVLGPNGGESLYPVNSYLLTWVASIFGNVRIELYKDGVFDSLIVAETPNDGEFNWNITKAKKAGAGFAIRVSSVTNDLAVSDLSDNTFIITDAQFPDGKVLPYGWFKPSGAKKTWKVTKSLAFEGTRCLVSEPTGDGATAGIAYRANFRAGVVNFYMKVSSEQNADLARFYIDDVPQVIDTLNSKSSLSGNVDWVFASFPVPAGRHTLKWTYEKDDSYKGLRDSAWLDGVVLPQTTQEIAVLNPKAESIIDGEHSASFPDTPSGEVSAAQTFTIKNVGKSALQQLRIVVKGANPDDFDISPLAKAVILPGKSATFQIIFAPETVALRQATIMIMSNDLDESPFSISVKGIGIGVPQISVSISNDKPLTDGGPSVSIGRAKVGGSGSSRVFTIINTGDGDLKGLKIAKSGVNRRDFSATTPGVTELAPGETTSFRVTFDPAAGGKRVAALNILSNDKRTGPFDIKLTGTGNQSGPRKPAAVSRLVEATLGRTSSSILNYQTTSVEVVDGKKYLVLTVDKSAAAVSPVAVEVSPNLLDWYTGKNHTTVIADDAKFLRVRDNTPVTPDTKRYIRVN